MKGIISYHFVGRTGYIGPYEARLTSEAYSYGLRARGETWAEARKNLVDNLLATTGEFHIPSDEEIEF